MKLLTTILVLAIVASTGCGGGPKVVPVEGKVTLKGKPLPAATVMFSQARPEAPGPFVGETDSNGQFKLGTTGSPGSGAAVGEYMVYITTVKQPPNALEDTPPPTQKEIVPTEFRDGSKRITVPADGLKTADFGM